MHNLKKFQTFIVNEMEFLEIQNQNSNFACIVTQRDVFNSSSQHPNFWTTVFELTTTHLYVSFVQGAGAAVPEVHCVCLFRELELQFLRFTVDELREEQRQLRRRCRLPTRFDSTSLQYVT